MSQSLLLSQQLPLTFKGTDFTFDEMTCNCKKCNKVIPEEYTTATVTRLIESVAEIRGEASCHCGEIERFAFRVRSNGTMQLLTPGGWLEYSLVPQPNIADRVIGYVKSLFS